MSTHTVTIYVQITDPTALWDAAAAALVNDGGFEDLQNFLGSREEPDISGCLRQLADPGQSWPGTSILDSAASPDIIC